MHERVWFKSKTSKILAFVSAILIMIVSNVLLNYIENKLEKKQEVVKVISNVSETHKYQNIYK
jgi:pyrroline-5-carboxylate reductase